MRTTWITTALKLGMIGIGLAAVGCGGAGSGSASVGDTAIAGDPTTHLEAVLQPYGVAPKMGCDALFPEGIGRPTSLDGQPVSYDDQGRVTAVNGAFVEYDDAGRVADMDGHPVFYSGADAMPHVTEVNRRALAYRGDGALVGANGAAVVYDEAGRFSELNAQRVAYDESGDGRVTDANGAHLAYDDDQPLTDSARAALCFAILAPSAR